MMMIMKMILKICEKLAILRYFQSVVVISQSPDSSVFTHRFTDEVIFTLHNILLWKLVWYVCETHKAKPSSAQVIPSVASFETEHRVPSTRWY